MATKLVYELTIITNYPKDIPDEVGGAVEFLTLGGSASNAWATQVSETEEDDWNE